MSNELSTNSTYQKLCDDLASLLQRGQQDALNKLNEIRVTTYWQMGKRMNEEKELIDADQSAAFIARLAADLNLDTSIIYRILQFYRTWPDGIPQVENTPALSWAHFTELLSIKDETERNFYLETSSKEEWGRNMLRKAIQKDLFTASQKPQKQKGDTTLERDPSPLYTYKAVVEKVVDGDTLLVRIDLGFNVWAEQRIRFRGINTEELSHSPSPLAGEGRGEGRQSPDRADQAKQFVADKLKDIPFVVIKTYKTDMYGRFVADVFYHPTMKKKEDIAEKGFFLNLELFTAGLADFMM